MNELEIVNGLIKKYLTNDPYEICSYLDYIVLQVPLVGIRGFYQFYDGQDIVYLDSGLPDLTR